MNRAMAIMLSTVLVLTSAVLIPGADSDPVNEVVGTYYEGWCRTSEPFDSSYLDITYVPRGVYLSEHPDDPAISGYIRGEIPMSELESASIEDGKSYYIYFASNSTVFSRSRGVEHLADLDHVDLEGPALTIIHLDKGAYRFEADVEQTGSSVCVAGGKSVAGNYPLNGRILDFTIVQGGTYYLSLNSDEYHCIHFRVVSGDVRALDHMEGVSPHEIATGFYWTRSEFMIEPGSWTFLQFTFPEGSGGDKMFRTEVAEALETDAPSWAEPNPTMSFTEPTRLAAYKLACSGSGLYSEDVYYSPSGTVYDPTTGHATAVSIRADVDRTEVFGPGSDDRLTLFAPANERVTLALTYDMSKYSVMMDTGQGAQSFIASDSRYDLEFDESSQLDLKIFPLGNGVGGPEYFSTTVLVSMENVPEPDGGVVAFSVICIAAFALAVCLLFYAGRGPRWNDERRCCGGTRLSVEPLAASSMHQSSYHARLARSRVLDPLFLNSGCTSTGPLGIFHDLRAEGLVSTENPKKVMTEDIDAFVVNRSSGRTYIQVAMGLDGPGKLEQEEASLLRIKDGFNKMILVDADVPVHHTSNGIRIMSIIDFMLDKGCLE